MRYHCLLKSFPTEAKGLPIIYNYMAAGYIRFYQM